MKTWLTYLKLPLGAIFIAGAIIVLQMGLSGISIVRQIERIPFSDISAVSTGPFALQGITNPGLKSIKTPYSEKLAVYYRYQLEEEYRDSDGDRATRVLESGERATDFMLAQGNQTIVVSASNPNKIEWSIQQNYSNQIGDKIYTEWALFPGTDVQLLGYSSDEVSGITFSDMPTQLPAIITDKNLKQEAGERVFYSGLIISAAIGLLSLGISLVITSLKIHRYLIFITFLAVTLTGIFWVLGTNTLVKDWELAHSLYQQRLQGYQAAPNPAKAADLYNMARLIQLAANTFPDNVFYQRFIANEIKLPHELSTAETLVLEQKLASTKEIKFESLSYANIILIVSFTLAVLVLWRGLKGIILKRIIEAIPTSKSRGLTYGLVELIGQIKVNQDTQAIRSKLKNHPCVAYQYTIKEKRGSGKNTKWVTIESSIDSTEFLLCDDEGEVLVNPSEFEIRYPLSEHWNEGNLAYTEAWLPPESNIYCLGNAEVNHSKNAQLSVHGSETGFALITTQSETELVLSEASKGFLLSSLSLSLFLVAGMTALAAVGNFSPTDIFSVSLVIPCFLIVVSIILHYNDLVFLRNRVQKIAADIDTLLIKRFNLWPSLATIVKSHMQHEKTLLASISEIRANQPSSNQSTLKHDKRMKLEQQAISKLIALSENYPDLKVNQLLKQFEKQLKESEQHLALIRNGLLNAKENYHTRIQSFPDILIAKLFRFKPFEN